MITKQKHSRISNLLSIDYSKVKGGITGLFLSIMICPFYSNAQENNSRQVIALQNQVAQLKSQISQLQAQNTNFNDDSDNYRKKRHKDKDEDDSLSTNNGLLPDLVSRINNLEDQQRVMRGEIDDLSNQLKTQNDLINKKIDDMNFAAGRGGASNGSSDDVVTDSKSEVSKKSSISDDSGTIKSVKPETGSTLRDGQQALLNGNFQIAESIAQKILSTPEGAKSPSARYLLAQAQAGQGNFKASSVNYYAVYKNFPKSPKAPSALLGVGYLMLKNGKIQEACQAVSLLHSKYPNVSTQVKSSALNLSRKAKCS
ncbi:MULTISPECIES: hypothetical protein [unclassified Commensalibacter]|uniref:hypothetical protein n=1 Tax=unclassified Commensalibacter TaxID=2630218 RepID=UPI0018DB6F45|nr:MULTISPECIES: hypothetical protein [unclassified Commensalibacter]MBH9969876.1 hypothetical protein [Commensalibacter sp. M0265]MBH9977228.1 hypothetical protein [Commensalibacter sp. M0266]MBH9992911.1 hypothetical protein [Commensalibacter sp. M0270]MBI0046404.1 hypothetical protein [Commensalibacter sp. M0267]MBI0056076.1 hypothetical protein [Commensalibacter sp. M0268]